MTNTFASLAEDAPAPLRGQFRAALEIRAAAPARAYLDARTADRAAADFVALLESVEPFGETYRFVLVRRDGGTSVLVTNVTVQREEDESWLDDSGDIRVYALTPGSESAARARDLERLRFQSGAGGKAGVFDGTTDLLTLRAAGAESLCALYGYDYEVFTAEPVRPDGEPDAGRYAAIDAVFRLLMRLLSENPPPIERIPITPARPAAGPPR